MYMAAMSDAERREFLLAGTRTAKVGTARRTGRPHVAPVWFLLDGDDVVFTTGVDSVKGRNLRRNPQAAICVDDDRPPFAFVLVEGTATFDTDLDELRRWAGAIGGRYMGQDRAEEMAKRNGVPGEMVVRVTPTRIMSENHVAI
jgi:PPOX class probable F420-dependent enzyme